MITKRCGTEKAHIGHNWTWTREDTNAGINIYGETAWCPGHIIGINPQATEPVMSPPDEGWKHHPSYDPQERMDRTEALIALDRHITDKHCVIWGGIWTVTDEERREEAIDWFLDVCERIGLLKTYKTPPDVTTESVSSGGVFPLRMHLDYKGDHQ